MGGLGSAGSTILAHSTQPCMEKPEWGQNGHRTTLQRRAGVLAHPQPLYNTRHHVWTRYSAQCSVWLAPSASSTKWLAQVQEPSRCGLKSIGRPGDVWRVRIITKYTRMICFFKNTLQNDSLPLGSYLHFFMNLGTKKFNFLQKKSKMPMIYDSFTGFFEMGPYCNRFLKKCSTLTEFFRILQNWSIYRGTP